MNANVFNACLLIGWLLVTIGWCMQSFTGGLIVSGLLLLAITAGVAKLGGIYVPKADS